MSFNAKGIGGSYSAAGRVVSMVAKFNSACKCGALIAPGDSMSYDTFSRKTLCYVCVRKNSDAAGSGIEDVDTHARTRGVNEKCYALIDRFRELRLAPRPLSDITKLELKEILIRFVNEFGTNDIVKKFVTEIARCKHSGAECSPIVAKFSSACIHCVKDSAPGELVLYDHHAKRVHCLICDCLRGL